MGTPEEAVEHREDVWSARPVYRSGLPAHWQPWWDSFELRHLRDFRQPTTLESYHDVMVQFTTFLASEGHVPEVWA